MKFKVWTSAAATVILLVVIIASAGCDGPGKLETALTLEDVCTSEIYDHHDVDVRMEVKEMDTGLEWVMLIKGRYSPDGFELLAELEDWDDEAGPAPTQLEERVLYDMGWFSREKFNANGSSDAWGAWEIWSGPLSDEEKKIEQSSKMTFGVKQSGFCGFEGLTDLKYVEDTTLYGEAVKYYKAEVPPKVTGERGPDDYWRIEFWVAGDKLLRLREEFQTPEVGRYVHAIITYDYSDIGVVNVIATPELPSGRQ